MEDQEEEIRRLQMINETVKMLNLEKDRINETLKKEVHILKEEQYRMIQQNDSLKSAIKDLKQEINRHQNSKSALSAENESLKKIIKDLKATNNKLKLHNNYLKNRRRENTTSNRAESNTSHRRSPNTKRYDLHLILVYIYINGVPNIDHQVLQHQQNCLHHLNHHE